MHYKRFSISFFEICSYCLIGYFVFNRQYTLEMINILETPLLLNNKEFCLTNHITIHLKLIHPRNSRRAHINIIQNFIGGLLFNKNGNIVVTIAPPTPPKHAAFDTRITK